MDIEENKTTKQLLLYHWVRIVKELYPNSRTENPYNEEYESISNQLTLDEKLLLHDLIHSITVINGHSRVNDNGQLISSHADLINALQLIIPDHVRLTQDRLEAYSKLSETFNDKIFTYQQAALILKVSKKTITRLFKSLLVNGLIDQLPTKPCDKALFQLIEKAPPEDNTSEEIFATMQGEWKDFVGFVEF